MINKIFTLIIRGGVTGILGLAVGAPLHSIEIASAIWIIGGIYTLVRFNDSYNIAALRSAEDKMVEIVDNKNKQKLEEEMLRIKNLRDKDILTEDEYNRKMNSLKDKYFE